MDQIFCKHLGKSQMQNLKTLHVSSADMITQVVSDKAARHFFQVVLIGSPNLTEISLPNLNLKGDSICTLLYSVILRAPTNKDGGL